MALLLVQLGQANATFSLDFHGSLARTLLRYCLLSDPYQNGSDSHLHLELFARSCDLALPPCVHHPTLHLQTVLRYPQADRQPFQPRSTDDRLLSLAWFHRQLRRTSTQSWKWRKMLRLKPLFNLTGGWHSSSTQTAIRSPMRHKRSNRYA